MKNEKRPEGLPTKPTKPKLQNDLLANAREMASYGELRRMHPQFTVDMHDQIIARLIQLDCMRPAWEELASATKRGNRRPMEIARGFLTTCLDAFMVYKLVPPRSPVAHRKHYKNIAMTTRKLLSEIGSDLELATWASGSTTPHGRMVEDMIGFSTRCGMPERQAEEVGMASRGYASQRAPHLLTILTELASHAEYIAGLGPLSTRPNKADSHEIYFVRRVSAWLREELGSPLHAVTACASNALFVSDMDAERVKGLANKNW